MCSGIKLVEYRTRLDGKTVTAVIVQNRGRAMKLPTDNFIQHVLDQQMPLDDQPQFIRVVSETRNVMIRDVLSDVHAAGTFVSLTKSDSRTTASRAITACDCALFDWRVHHILVP